MLNTKPFLEFFIKKKLCLFVYRISVYRGYGWADVLATKYNCHHSTIIQNLKIHNRSRIVRKLINHIEYSTEKQLARKLTILDTVHAQKKAWSAVTSTTIVNCFKKGGFHIPDNTDLQTDKVTTPLETPSEMTATSFEEYMDIDNNLPCTGLPRSMWTLTITYHAPDCQLMMISVHQY